MFKSLTYVLIALFSLSLPLSSWALVASVPAGQDAAAQSSVDDLFADREDGPSCPKDESAARADDGASGATASTDPEAADAYATACCWIFFNGRWYCIPCF